MAKRKRKKKHWTTKNTHIKRMKKQPENKKEIKFIWWEFILIILLVIWMIFKIVNSQNRCGYDHYPGMPDEWIKWVK